MQTAYNELLIVKDKLPTGDPIGPQPIHAFNEALNDAHTRTRHNQILELRITDQEVIAIRPDPQSEIEYYIPRERFLAKLKLALAFLESHS